MGGDISLSLRTNIAAMNYGQTLRLNLTKPARARLANMFATRSPAFRWKFSERTDRWSSLQPPAPLGPYAFAAVPKRCMTVVK
jgi:hypothetical protein